MKSGKRHLYFGTISISGYYDISLEETFVDNICPLATYLLSVSNCLLIRQPLIDGRVKS